MKDIDLVIKDLAKDSYQREDNYISVIHPDNLDITFELDIETKGKQKLIDEKKLSQFLSVKYITGKFLIRKDYFEAVVDFTNLFDYYDDKSTTIEPNGVDYQNKCHYEIGEVSDEFGVFLNQTIHWDNFSTEYYQSIKLYNLSKLISDDYKSDAFLDKTKDFLSAIFFQLISKYDLRIRLLDLDDYDKFEPELDEVDTSMIESTIIEPNNYDMDLVNYYNSAIHMTDSSFKYLAFFQVIECLFDEVYRDETIQDAKSVINSNWFNSQNSDDILKLIKLIDKFSKEQNDRNKIRLVLEKYFKMNLHDEAYFLAYSDISDKLIALKLIKDSSEIKDLQKVGSIIYDIRCEYTHSNRNFPKRNQTQIDEKELIEHISLIKMFSRVIIENYRKR
ncbi:MAG: hypothetical protein WC055_17080 [Melioribacteraceae bacterium]